MFLHPRGVTAGAALLLLLSVLTLAPAGQAPPSGPYTLLSREGRRPLNVRTVNGQEMFALEDLAKTFDLSLREDTLAGGLAISSKGQTIALTAGQALVSVGGRVVSLSTPPLREGRTWFVPLEFVPRALGPALGTRLELRRPSRLVVAGDLRVPRITARVEGLGSGARVTLEVAPSTPHAVSEEAARITVRFEADALDASLPPSPAPDLVQAMRVAETGAAVVIDLGPRFSSFRSSSAPGARGAATLMFDVLPQTTDSPAGPPAGTAPAAPDPPPLLEATPLGALRTIVVDAGHGGNEPGARGPQGTLEKDITLGVARRLKGAIESRLGLRVILTRDGDATVGLDERAAVANNNKADLFLSLHASASVRPVASGAEVFYLRLADYGDEAQRLAQAQSDALPVHGGGTRDIEVILWEMAQARHIDESAALAQLVDAALRERVPMSPRGIQQAPLRVLVGANMPAVLIEMGYMTNPDQEKHLASGAFQASVAEALFDSIVRFRDRRGAPAPPQPPQPGTGGSQ